MPNSSSSKDSDRRYSRRKSIEQDHYSSSKTQMQMSNYSDYNSKPSRNSSKEKKSVSSSSSSSTSEKVPLRTLGDWSEYLSSTGKIYYHNIKTDKAQWDKPDDWDWLVSHEDKSFKNSYNSSNNNQVKDYRSSNNRYKPNKYENESFNDSASMKSRYNSGSSGGYDNKSYQREYSNDYPNQNSSSTSYRSNSYNHSLSDQSHRTYNSMPQDNSSNQMNPVTNQMNDHHMYDYSMYYNSNNGNSYRNYQPQGKEQDKYWAEQQQRNLSSKSRMNSDDMSYRTSPSRYSSNYDNKSSSSSSSYMYQRHHTSRYDSYQSIDDSKFPASDPYGSRAPPAQANPSSSSANNMMFNPTCSYMNNSEAEYMDRYSKQQAPPPGQQQHAPRDMVDPYDQPSSRNYRNSSRSSSGSNRSPVSSYNYGRGSYKKMKKSDDSLSQSKSNNSSSKLDKSDYYEASNANNQAESMYGNGNEQTVANSQLNGINNLKLNNEDGLSSSESNKKSKENQSDGTRVEQQTSDVGVKSESDNKNQSEQNTSQSASSHVNIVLNTNHWCSVNHEDISKYYRPELAYKLHSCLGANENFSLINQPYLKQLSVTNLNVELKNYRSLVRIKEIKKTIQEQRLAFLQNQMKEIEELLN